MDEPRSLVRPLLRVLIVALFTMMCYQLGHNRGYDQGSAEAAGRPVPPELLAHYAANSNSAASDEEDDFTVDALAHRPAPRYSHRKS